MRILVATVTVPFVRGAAEVNAECLRHALRGAGHDAEIVSIPFKGYPAEKILDQMLACRLFDVTESCGTRIDLLIGLRFPAYLIPHPNKVLWLQHQHRQAYDRWEHELGDLHGDPSGSEVRDAIRRADRSLIPEATAVFAGSHNVARRLKKYCGVDSMPLYHPPPDAERIYSAEAEDYLVVPRCPFQNARQSLVLEALAHAQEPVCVRFAGPPADARCAAALRQRACELSVLDRVHWMGSITKEAQLRCYAHARGVIDAPMDEDDVDVILEALLASKPVVTCSDSGGPVELIEHEENGLIAEPTPHSLGAALDELWRNPRRAKRWGEAGRARYERLHIGWPEVVQRLLG
jgi:glycosyltransferase involved in cell wall biosynthesis